MKGMFMRRSFILLAAAVMLAIGTGGCGSKSADRTMLNTVCTIEKSTYELNAAKISYADYKKSTDKYLSKYVPSLYIKGNIIYADKDFVNAVTGKNYAEKDWLGMSFEEIKKIGEPLSRSVAMNVLSFNYKSCGISKVYEDSGPGSSLQMKSVYVRRDIKADGLNAPLYKKYTFIKDGKSYVLLSFENISAPEGQELTFGDEKVDFVQNIDLE